MNVEEAKPEEATDDAANDIGIPQVKLSGTGIGFIVSFLQARLSLCRCLNFFELVQNGPRFVPEEKISARNFMKLSSELNIAFD
jgi:hypothetical protein